MRRKLPGSRQPVGTRRVFLQGEFIPIRKPAGAETGCRRATLAFEAPIVYSQKFPRCPQPPPKPAIP
jgi:hypothetical protein